MTTANGPTRHIGLQALVGSALAGIGAVLLYKLVAQPWHLHWGATPEEIARTMPGDEVIVSPDYVSTRAVTIHAKPEHVYPWLVQMGQGRGGAYSYDWIENVLGLDFHSADTIIPKLQDLKVGDTIPLEPNGTGLKVLKLVKDDTMTLVLPEEGWTWDFGVYPVDEKTTRLVSRNRFDLDETSLAFRFYLKMIEPGAFLMERKMLLGIKERAENLMPKKAELDSAHLLKIAADDATKVKV